MPSQVAVESEPSAFHTTIQESLSISKPKHWPISTRPLELSSRETLLNQQSEKLWKRK